MIVEVDRTNIVRNLRYSLSLQFIERLERGNKIDSGKRLCLKDAIENENGITVVNVQENFKKELRKIKIKDGRREMFNMKEEGLSTSLYVEDDSRSHYDKLNWKNSSFPQDLINSESNPRYYRTASKNKYIRSGSNNARDRSGGKFGLKKR